MCRLPACGHSTRREGHHGTTTNDTVVTSRYSRVYYQTSPTKSDGVSESVHCSLGDITSRMCPPVSAHRCCQCEFASDLERRAGALHQRRQVKWFRDNHAVHCQTHETPWVDKNETIAHDANNHAMNTTCKCTPKHSPIASKCLVTRTVIIQQRRTLRQFTISEKPHATHALEKGVGNEPTRQLLAHSVAKKKNNNKTLLSPYELRNLSRRTRAPESHGGTTGLTRPNKLPARLCSRFVHCQDILYVRTTNSDV